MSAIRSTGNKTETNLRKMLFKAGYRYRKYLAGLPGRPDIVFMKAKIAIFVDGDYWHARVISENGPKAYEPGLRTSNKDYWMKKFKRRLEIDKAVNERLAALGWCVLRFWESDIKGDLTSAFSIIGYHLQSRSE
jgi:DNA mismatch endonuclease (patch repair protein)